MKSVFAVALLLFVSIATAGSLTPPGAPSATFKTLDEAAPGILITQDMIPLMIDKPGHYYLVENIYWKAEGAAITIMAPDVDLDLNGFAIDGLDRNVLETRIGIDCLQGPSVVRNGSIVRMSAMGIWGDYLNVEDVIVREVAGHGIRIIYGAVRRCTVHDVIDSSIGKTAGLGIFAEYATLVEDCVVREVTGALPDRDVYGIMAQHGSTVRRCSVESVRDSVFSGTGFLIVGIMVRGSTAESCEVDNIRAYEAASGATGIMGESAVIRKCRIANVMHPSDSRGVEASFESMVEGCHITVPCSGETGAMSAGIVLEEYSLARDNFITIWEPSPTTSALQYGVLLYFGSMAEANTIVMTSHFFSSHSRIAVGLEGMDHGVCMISNRVTIELSLWPHTVYKSRFYFGTSGGYAAANVGNAPSTDWGSNTLGTVPAPNVTY